MTSRAQDRYATVAIWLHWLTAAAILFQIGLAWRMDEGRTPLGFALIQLHKSVGITILALSLARLAWRLTHPAPEFSGDLAPWERRLAKAVHVAFYVVLIGMPLTGWIMVSTSRIEIPTLLYGAIPWPHVPGLADLPQAAKHGWNEVAERAHSLLGWGLYGLLALHVGGALKHQLFDRDQPVLARMAPGAVAGRWFDPRLLMIAAGVVVVATTAWTIHPKVKFGGAPLPPPPAAAAPEPEPVAPAAPAETTAPAATPPAAPVEPAKSAEPIAWKVASGSTLGFGIKWGDTPVQGRFDRWTADISFNPDALDTSKLRVEIDMASVATGDSQVDSSLPGEDWFDVSGHPKAVFTATRFEKTGKDRYVARGTLSMRGQTRPVRLPFRLQIEGDKARVSGVTTLDRTAFGVGQGEWKSTDQIPAEVTVNVNLTATKRP